MFKCSNGCLGGMHLRENSVIVLYFFQDCTTMNRLTNKLRQFPSLHEGKMLPTIFGSSQKNQCREVCHIIYLQLMFQGLGNVADYLRIRLNNTLSGKERALSDSFIASVQ